MFPRAKLLWDKKTFTVNKQCIQVKGVKVVSLRSLPFPETLLPTKHSPMVGKNGFRTLWIRNQNPRCGINCWLILRRVSESKVIIWLPQVQGQTYELLIILTHLSKIRFYDKTHIYWTLTICCVINLGQSKSNVVFYFCHYSVSAWETAAGVVWWVCENTRKPSAR